MKTKAVFFLFLISLSLILYNCTGNSSSNNGVDKNDQPIVNNISIDSSILKIYVNKDGKVRVNEREISLAELDSFIDSAKSKTKTVYYSRYNAQEYEGPKESLLVLDIIVKYSLPVRFYTDSTFSQVANMN